MAKKINQSNSVAIAKRQFEDAYKLLGYKNEAAIRLGKIARQTLKEASVPAIMRDSLTRGWWSALVAEHGLPTI